MDGRHRWRDGQCLHFMGSMLSASRRTLRRRRYKIFEQVGEAGVYSEGGAYVNQHGGVAGGFTSTTNNRMMIIQCNDPAIEAALAKKRSM